MTFAVDGGIEWEKDETNKVLTIKPASSPESGYESGQMKDYDEDRPWSGITESGWTLTLEEGITHIGRRAFNLLYELTGSLVIPNSVQTIGDSAFLECPGFTGTLTIPANVTSIGFGAFNGCSGFTGSLTIPESVTNIGNCAFGGCSGLTGTLTIPSGVTTLGEIVFSETGFTGTLTIPANVTSIGVGAFFNCPNFTDVKFLGNQPTLGEYAFWLKNTSPSKTYDVYTNGWADATTFPEYDYTKWNYIIDTGSNTYVYTSSGWKKGTPYVWDGSTWHEGRGEASVYTSSGWKK